MTSWTKHYPFALALFVPYVLSICYYPDGTPTPSDVPCYNGDEASFCCGWGFACLSNKVCSVTDKTPNPNSTSFYVRGSCTDETWRSGNCPNFCVNPDYDLLGGGEGMARCPGTQNVFYCYDGNLANVDCGKLENIAFQSTGIPYALTTIGFGSSTTSSTTTTSPITTSPTRSTDRPHATPTASSTPTNIPTPAPTPVGTIAGATIGGVIGLAALALVVFWLYRKDRRKSWSDPKEDQSIGLTTSYPPRYSLGHAMPKYQQEFTHELYSAPGELEGEPRKSELPALSPMGASRDIDEFESSTYNDSRAFRP